MNKSLEGTKVIPKVMPPISFHGNDNITTDSNSTVTLLHRANSQLHTPIFQDSHYH